MSDNFPTRLQLFGTVAATDSFGRGRFLLRAAYDFDGEPHAVRDWSAARLRAAMPVGRPREADPAVSAGLIPDEGYSAAGMPYRLRETPDADGVVGEFWVVLSREPARQQFWRGELAALSAMAVYVEVTLRRFFYPASAGAPAHAGCSLDMSWMRRATAADILAVNKRVADESAVSEPATNGSATNGPGPGSAPAVYTRPVSAAMRARVAAAAEKRAKLKAQN